MPENEQMTHSQHFISKMYFRQFSENKKNLYRYDANDLDKPPEIRSINKICREIDMYEPVYKDGSYVVSGSMNIDDFFELIGFESEDYETDYTTVGGFCQDILDRFGKKDDEFDFDHYHFRILEADKYTIEKLLVTNLDPIDDEE